MAFNPIYKYQFMQQNPIITINFYNDKQLIYLPFKFSEFLSKIFYITQIPQSSYSCLIFYYFDNNNNKFYIQSEIHYNHFYKMISMNYLHSKNIFIEHNQINMVNHNKENKPLFQTPVFNVSCFNCKINPIPKVVYYCIPLKYFICTKCEKTIGQNIGFPLVKICNYDALKDALQLESAQPFTDKFYSNITEGNNVSSAFPKNNPLLSNINNLKNNIEDINKDKISNENNIKININNMEILVAKIKQEYDLKIWTDRQIEIAIKKANGNFEQALIYLIN